MHATAQRAGGGPPDPRMEYWRPTAQTSLSWLADTLLSQDRAAPIRFCRPTAPSAGLSTRCTVHGMTSRQGRFVRIDSLSGDDQPAAPGVGPREILHNGQTYTVAAAGFVLLASGRRDKRYRYPLGKRP